MWPVLPAAPIAIAAESGATINQSMAIFGWTKPEMAALYNRKADLKRLARGAMRLISSR
jgi:hypothetical protein